MADTIAPASRSPEAPSFGTLPEWNLADLYPGIDSPEIAEDLGQALTLCKAFEDANKGRLDTVLGEADGATRLAAIIADYEAIEDKLGRIASFAGLVYAGDTTDPKRSKFYGDVQERLT